MLYFFTAISKRNPIKYGVKISQNQV